MRQTALVLATDWNVGGTFPASYDADGKPDLRHKLSVFKIHPTKTAKDVGWIIYHPDYDGMLFDSEDSKDLFCLSVGLLKVYKPLYGPGL